MRGVVLIKNPVHCHAGRSGRGNGRTALACYRTKSSQRRALVCRPRARGAVVFNEIETANMRGTRAGNGNGNIRSRFNIQRDKLRCARIESGDGVGMLKYLRVGGAAPAGIVGHRDRISSPVIGQVYIHSQRVAGRG